MSEDRTPELEADGLRGKYDASAANWDADFSSAALNRIHGDACWRAFRRAIGRDCGTSLAVELGVGTGLFTDRLSSEFSKLIAVDFSQKMLDMLQQKLEARGILNVTYMQADATDLRSVSSGSVDAVFCFGLLENVSDAGSLLREVRRILKPMGRFAGVVSNRSCPWYAIRKLVSGRRWYWEDIRLYSAADLRSAATAAGLRERAIRGWGLVPSQVPNSAWLAPLELAERALEVTPLSRFMGGLAFCFERP